jgi:hypothetical protein
VLAFQRLFQAVEMLLPIRSRSLQIDANVLVDLLGDVRRVDFRNRCRRRCAGRGSIRCRRRRMRFDGWRGHTSRGLRRCIVRACQHSGKKPGENHQGPRNCLAVIDHLSPAHSGTAPRLTTGRSRVD